MCVALVARTSLDAQARAEPDSVIRARADSIARADSVVGSLPQAEAPMLTEVGMSHRWGRDSLFSTGALTLADFLDRVPGLTTMRARFYMAPQVGAYNGDVARVRLFLDGVELEALDPRSDGITELSQFPIAALEELIVERGANELRLHMRSWRGPNRVTSETRADVATGDSRSNTFRGFLARRAKNGFAFQTMLQQRSTEDRVVGGDGDATTIFARVGVIKERWSLDGTLVRVRTTQQTLNVFPADVFLATGRAIPRYDRIQREAYLRFAIGDANRGSWLQLLAASRQSAERSPLRARDVTQGFAADSADTTTTSTQYVATAGWSSDRVRLSLTERLRLVGGRTLHQPSARVGIDLGRLTASAYAERNPFEEVIRADALVRLQPAKWFALTGAASYGTTGSISLPLDSTGRRDVVGLPVARAVRGEAVIRLGRLWFQGGGVVRDSAVLRAPGLFDRTTPAIVEGRALGVTYSIVGPLFRGFSVHISGMQWENAGWYRPRTQVRSELTWRYHWTGATTTGGFDFVLSGDAEYRSAAFVPVLTSRGSVTTIPTFAATPLGLRAEFTLKDASIFVQVRNILDLPYSTVPGLLMPSPITVYGVRWTFWN